MARIRAVVTLPWTSNLPEDVTINTFHFLTANPAPDPGDNLIITGALEAFYNGASGGVGTELAGHLSNLVSRVALACNIELFDLDDPEPRVPITNQPFTLAAADSATSGPTEVALCCSFQAAPISGVPQSRRRGRVYIGPFNQNANGNDARPAAAVVASVAAAGNFLLDSLSGVSTVRWCVYSRTADALAEVADGWVDNEWDAMRSRGRRATSRTLFT